MELRVATWNVNGIRARREQFEEWVGRDRPDVVCLQEIKSAPDKLPVELCELPGYWCYWHGAGGYSGVSLHARRETLPEPPAFSHPAFDHETRIVAADLAIPGGESPLTVASVYVPNGGKDYPAKLAFLEALAGWAAELRQAGRRLVLCGDLNVTRTDQDVHPKELKPGVIGQRPDERALLEAVLGAGLFDVGRTLDPENDRLFTWWAPWRNLRQRNIGWRIDYLLASAGLTAKSCTVLAEVGTSDHAPVVATFEV
jgi:exodeoxyribonuclease III